MYLDADLSKMTNLNGKEYWAVSSDNYCVTEVTIVESVLEKCGLRFLPKCVISLSCGYRPYMDVTGDIKEDGFQCYQ